MLLFVLQIFHKCQFYWITSTDKESHHLVWGFDLCLVIQFNRIRTTLGCSPCAMYCTLQCTELVFRGKAPNLSSALTYNRVFKVSGFYRMFDGWKLLV